MRKKLLLFLGLILGAVSLASAQPRTVRGTVTAGEDGSPLVQLTVLVKGTTTGVVTDMDGRYSIQVPGPEAVLVFKYTGYETQEILVAEQSTIDVVMRESLEEIDEVMVVAYGTTTKESFTGSADVVDSKKLERRKVSNITKGLDGLAPGVLTTSGSGQPGSGSKIQIRGIGSMNASSDPLYVVDGIPYDGDVSAISPDDIKSMTVLKDASAGALYGARGANGVVMITTRRGDSQKEDMRVNFRSSWGISQRAVPEYETLNAEDWIVYQFYAARNLARTHGVTDEELASTAIDMMFSGSYKLFGDDGRLYPYEEPFYELFDPETATMKAGTMKWKNDWMETVLDPSPLRQEYTLTLEGAGKSSNYMLSFGYLNEKGLLKETAFERFSGRVSLDARPKEWFKAGLNTNFSLAEQNFKANLTGTYIMNVFYSAAYVGPIYPVHMYNEDGSVMLDAQGKPEWDFGKDRPGGSANGSNSPAQLFANSFHTNRDGVSARAYVNLLDLKEGPLQGFKIALNVGGDFTQLRSKGVQSSKIGDAAGSGGATDIDASRIFSFTANQLLSYTRTFADVHSIDFLVGHESYRWQQADVNVSKGNFEVDGLTELSAGTVMKYVEGATYKHAIESFLSRLNYSYASRYYFSASYRRDASSRFAPEHRWGDFWSVGANWRISSESFMESTKDWLDNLGLRVSYGIQGNEALPGLLPYQSLYALGWKLGGAQGGVLNSFANYELSWEENANFNVAVDGRVFNRLGFTLEYYIRTTYNMLMSKPMAPSLGFSAVDVNAGKMRNMGIDFSLNAKLLQIQDFVWTASLLGSTMSNTVLELVGDDEEIVSGSRITKVGEPYNSYYLPKSGGIDPATGKQLYVVYDVDEKTQKRSAPYLTSDFSKASNCREVAGVRYPDLYGSFSTELSWRGIDLSMLFSYSIGGQFFDSRYSSLMYPMYYGSAIHVDAKRAWKRPGDITDIPVSLPGGIPENFTSDYLMDASYFAVKNISLGYSFPTKWMQKIHMQKARLSLVADNIVTFSYLKGYDSQQFFTGGTDYSYVPVRTFSFNVELTF